MRVSSCATTRRLVFRTLGDGLPVVGRERAQVDDLDAQALLLLGLPRGDERAVDERAVGDDGQVALAHRPRLAEGARKPSGGYCDLL